MASTLRACYLFGLASLALADYRNGYGTYYGGNNGQAEDGDGDFSQFGSSSANNPSAQFLAQRRSIVIAHAVLASAAFVLFFPTGSILIRLGNFRGLWLVHGVFQIFAYLLYIAAAAIGIYITTHVRVITQPHPIIGLVLLVLLLFQPVLGLLHHFLFRKHARRVIWSYGHIWLGRIIITLGIINGGLGLQLARRLRFFPPSSGAVVAYIVVAIVMWLAYIVAAIVGERRRSRQARVSAPVVAAATNGSIASLSDNDKEPTEYYKNEHPA